MVPVAVVVSQLLARAAPVAYTNRVCAEGLHVSVFHFIQVYICCLFVVYAMNLNEPFSYSVRPEERTGAHAEILSLRSGYQT